MRGHHITVQDASSWHVTLRHEHGCVAQPAQSFSSVYDGDAQNRCRLSRADSDSVVPTECFVSEDRTVAGGKRSCWGERHGVVAFLGSGAMGMACCDVGSGSALRHCGEG